MICPYCNNSIEDNSTKCDICGVELSKQDILKDSLKEQDVLNKVYKGYKIFYTLLMTAIGLAIAIFFGGCGLFFPPAFGFAIIGVSIIISAIVSYKEENVVLKTNYINQWLYTIGFYFFVFGFLLLFDIDIFKHIDEYGMNTFYFTLVFWFVGIIFFLKSIIGLLGKGKDK